MNDYRENEWPDAISAPIGRAHLMRWLCLFGFVGFLIWLALP
jgi:hypothetical protein